MHRYLQGRVFSALALAALWLVTGCEVWTPPAPTTEELNRGLVVMYPGDFNSSTEMFGFYTGLREGGIDQAIEISRWSLPLESCYARERFWEKFPAWAEQEARRLVAYQQTHPGAPVTLLGYSGGGMAAILVAESMPEGTAVDRALLLSPGVTPDYDLTPMLEGVRDRVIVYWSPEEARLGSLLLQWVGTVDGSFEAVAAISGFRDAHDKLVQIQWTPEMAELGNHGDHLDYFMNVPWVSKYVAAWIAQPPPSVRARAVASDP